MATLPKAIINVVNIFERLPGIGPKSATRLAFYLLNAPESFVEGMSNDLIRLKKEIKICQKCFGVSENDLCDICNDVSRNQNQICVVERAIDVIAIENLGGYRGVYHVLGGVMNPLNHISPDDLKIAELIEKVETWPGSGQASDDLEVILATNPTMEGEATALYIRKKIDGKAKVTRIGSGLPMGADLEFADQATLSRAMEGRTTL